MTTENFEKNKTSNFVSEYDSVRSTIGRSWDLKIFRESLKMKNKWGHYQVRKTSWILEIAKTSGEFWGLTNCLGMSRMRQSWSWTLLRWRKSWKVSTSKRFTLQDFADALNFGFSHFKISDVQQDRIGRCTTEQCRKCQVYFKQLQRTRLPYELYEMELLGVVKDNFVCKFWGPMVLVGHQ